MIKQQIYGMTLITQNISCQVFHEASVIYLIIMLKKLKKKL